MDTNTVKAVAQSPVPAVNGKHEPTVEELKARIALLETKISKGSTIRFKVSEKGGVSVYGMGRFPVSLYLSQWAKLFSVLDELKAFIEANRSKLSVKE